MQSFSKEFTAPQEEKSKIRYIGPALGTFLLAEKNNSLYIIDQHAAHERILFDKIMNSQGGRQQHNHKLAQEQRDQTCQIQGQEQALPPYGQAVHQGIAAAVVQITEKHHHR